MLDKLTSESSLNSDYLSTRQLLHTIERSSDPVDAFIELAGPTLRDYHDELNYHLEEEYVNSTISNYLEENDFDLSKKDLKKLLEYYFHREKSFYTKLMLLKKCDQLEQVFATMDRSAAKDQTVEEVKFNKQCAFFFSYGESISSYLSRLEESFAELKYLCCKGLGLPPEATSISGYTHLYHRFIK
tara:strand:- start:264 stop:821 length:558 start_codon:yes stop_codon:yes gene_type:complete